MVVVHSNIWDQKLRRHVNQNVDNDYCACGVNAVGVGVYSYKRGPKFFMNRDPARSKSGLGDAVQAMH